MTDSPDRQSDQKIGRDNIPLPFFVRTARYVKKPSTPEELSRWEKEVSELAGFKVKSNDSSSYTFSQANGNDISDADIEPALSLEGALPGTRPLPIIFTLQNTRYKKIESPEMLKQWEEAVGNQIRSVTLGREIIPQGEGIARSLVESVSDCGGEGGALLDDCDEVIVL